MRHFLHLMTLPSNTVDLAEIIDKAGSFLIKVPDLQRAEALFTAAATSFPQNAEFRAAIGYCAGRSGRKEEAVMHQRKAVELHPSPTMLSDLGWSLIEGGAYSEAREALGRAILLDPANVRARANLDYLESITR